MIDSDECDGCGLCVDVCPALALRVVQGKVRLLHTDCDYCGECEAACPTGAITCPFEIVWE
ncbi:MAG: 4Fe-4S binding protein [Sphingomonadaceae bacterium]